MTMEVHGRVAMRRKCTACLRWMKTPWTMASKQVGINKRSVQLRCAWTWFTNDKLNHARASVLCSYLHIKPLIFATICALFRVKNRLHQLLLVSTGQASSLSHSMSNLHSAPAKLGHTSDHVNKIPDIVLTGESSANFLSLHLFA